MERKMKQEKNEGSQLLEDKFVGVTTSLMTREIVRDHQDQSQRNDRQLIPANIALPPIRPLPQHYWIVLKKWLLIVTK